MPSQRATNALTIDVEDYFQVSAFAPHIPRSEWAVRECRVERNVDCILAMLDDHNTKATFFTLGWVAERYPEVIKRIVSGGHELASHGYGHERASDQTPDGFFSDIQVAKLILEDLAGYEVKGYRAPSFSIGEKISGPLNALSAPATTTAPVSTPSATTITACRMHRATPTK